MRVIGRVAASLWLSAGLLAASAGLGGLVIGPAIPAEAAARTASLTSGGSLPGSSSTTASSATATATPSTAGPGGTVTFAITCASTGASSATLFGSPISLPERIPMNNDGGGLFSVTVSLPAGLEPGRYHPDMDCSDGSSARAFLHVTGFPSGGAQTGDGTTATETDSGLAALGLAMIAVGAVAGGIGLRRRQSARRS
jgi:hypothetical protein